MELQAGALASRKELNGVCRFVGPEMGCRGKHCSREGHGEVTDKNQNLFAGETAARTLPVEAVAL